MPRVHVERVQIDRERTFFSARVYLSNGDHLSVARCQTLNAAFDRVESELDVYFENMPTTRRGYA